MEQVRVQEHIIEELGKRIQKQNLRPPAETTRLWTTPTKVV
jgi:hypothetical protein